MSDIVRLQGQYSLLGFIDDVRSPTRAAKFLGLPLWCGRNALEEATPEAEFVVIAVGDCRARLALATRVRARGLRLASAVHPSAVIAEDVVVRPGTVVAASATVNPGCRVGGNTIINTAASVDHDCVLADGVHICPGATLAGGVKVGRGTQIGLGACIIDDITIGAHSLIGAGAVVARDISSHVVAFGVPARPQQPAKGRSK